MVIIETYKRSQYLGNELGSIIHHTANDRDYWSQWNISLMDFGKAIEFRNILCCGVPSLCQCLKMRMSLFLIHLVGPDVNFSQVLTLFWKLCLLRMTVVQPLSAGKRSERNVLLQKCRIFNCALSIEKIFIFFILLTFFKI